MSYMGNRSWSGMFRELPTHTLRPLQINGHAYIKTVTADGSYHTLHPPPTTGVFPATAASGTTSSSTISSNSSSISSALGAHPASAAAAAGALPEQQESDGRMSALLQQHCELPLLLEYLQLREFGLPVTTHHELVTSCRGVIHGLQKLGLWGSGFWVGEGSGRHHGGPEQFAWMHECHVRSKQQQQQHQVGQQVKQEEEQQQREEQQEEQQQQQREQLGQEEGLGLLPTDQGGTRRRRAMQAGSGAAVAAVAGGQSGAGVGGLRLHNASADDARLNVPLSNQHIKQYLQQGKQQQQLQQQQHHHHHHRRQQEWEQQNHQQQQQQQEQQQAQEQEPYIPDAATCSHAAWHVARYILPDYADRVGRDDATGEPVADVDPALPALRLNKGGPERRWCVLDALQQVHLPEAVGWVKSNLDDMPLFAGR